MCVNGCTADNYRDFLMCQNHLWATAKGEYTAPLKPEPKIPPQNTPISDGFGAAAAVPDEENPIKIHPLDFYELIELLDTTLSP